MDLRKLKFRKGYVDMEKAAYSGGLTFLGANPYKKPKPKKEKPYKLPSYKNYNWGVGVGK